MTAGEGGVVALNVLLSVVIWKGKSLSCLFLLIFLRGQKRDAKNDARLVFSAYRLFCVNGMPCGMPYTVSDMAY